MSAAVGPRDPAIDAIISLTAWRGSASVAVLVGPGHRGWVRTVRQAAMLAIRLRTAASYRAIAAHLGGKGLSQVSEGVREARRRFRGDANFRSLVERVLADYDAEPVEDAS